jgi:hypothetical protein
MSLGGELARTALVAAMLFVSLASACTAPRAASPQQAGGAGLGEAEAAGAADARETPDEPTTPEPGQITGADPQANDDAHAAPCPADMVLVDSSGSAPRRFCVDRYEASLVEVASDGTEKPFPHYLPVDGHDVRAVSKPSMFPQGYISEVQAADACASSGKRLCNLEEWKIACMGPAHTTFPYGDARRPGACHDTGKSAVIAVFGAKAVAASTPYVAAPSASSAASARRAPHVAPATAGTSAGSAGRRAHVTKGRAAQTSRPRATAAKAAAKPSRAAPSSTAVAGGRAPRNTRLTTGKKSARPASVDPGVWARLNDPGLGQVEGALSRTGEHDECVNGYGVFDMVGNLHEWVATDPAAVHGTFAGGYYLDTTINGDGCNYRTVAHAHDYHDYSTGFRCCSGAAPPRP